MGVVLDDGVDGGMDGGVGVGGEFVLVFAGGTRGCSAGVGATEDAHRDVADMGGVVAVGDRVRAMLGRHGYGRRGKMIKMARGEEQVVVCLNITRTCVIIIKRRAPCKQMAARGQTRGR